MNDKDEKVAVTIQWYKANVVRLVFNGRVIWETKEIALNDIVRDAADAVCDAQDSGGPGLNGVFRETTLRLDALEATNYSRILLQGLQVGRLEKINSLVQLRVEQWQMKVILFERQLKQRMVDMGLAELLKAIDPDNPTSYVDDENCCNGRCCDCDHNCSYRDCDCKECADELNCTECADGLGIEDGDMDDDDTLRMCKDCDVERDSCAGCKDADPNDRYMNDGDIADAVAKDANTNAERAGGVGLADSDGIYQR